MAGTLTISTLSDGTNSTSSTNCIQGSAKAWVNFNGVTTATIRASYNVSSVTRSSAGVYAVNFTNAFADANYSCVATGGDPTYDSVITRLGSNAYPPSFSTTSVRIISTNQSPTAYEQTYYCVAVFR